MLAACIEQQSLASSSKKEEDCVIMLLLTISRICPQGRHHTSDCSTLCAVGAEETRIYAILCIKLLRTRRTTTKTQRPKKDLVSLSLQCGHPHIMTQKKHNGKKCHYVDVDITLHLQMVRRLVSRGRKITHTLIVKSRA